MKNVTYQISEQDKNSMVKLGDVPIGFFQDKNGLVWTHVSQYDITLQTIDDLELFCLGALNIDTIGLYRWLAELYIRQTDSTQIKNVHLDILGYLMDGIPDQEFTPMRLADKAWGMGSSELYNLDTCYLHEVYYADVIAKINQFFVDRIFLLCKTDKQREIAKSSLDDLERYFTISNEYLQGKNSFYVDGPNYAKFKNQRWEQKANVASTCLELKKNFQK